MYEAKEHIVVRNIGRKNTNSINRFTNVDFFEYLKNSNLGQSAYQIFAFSSFVSYDNALFFHTFLLN